MTENRRVFKQTRRCTYVFAVFLFVFLEAISLTASPVDSISAGSQLELTRAVRPWEFVSALGMRGGLIGNEGGSFEAWVYPLKIFRNFHLRFKVEGQVIDGKLLARSISVRPEATTITYVWDTFTVRETLLVPLNEPGAVIRLEVDAAQPIQIEAAFERDFQLEWPGAMGGTDIDWVPSLHAFSMTENQEKFYALVGSPQATEFHQEYVTNYSADRENSFSFGSIPAGKSTKVIVIAASFEGLPHVDATYRKLSNTYTDLEANSAKYYKDYLQSHVSLELPDAALQNAYEWAQISTLQGLVTNPYLGTGLVAGYKISGDDQRPGYAWFFGRDALWTSLALDAAGDFATTRAAIEFLCKYQRADGKVTHEIAQGASFVSWFDKMPYAYAAADATPLLIIAMSDYVRRSGDLAFAAGKWDNIRRAHDFILSTYDKNGLPRNEGVGHGWVEGGPLLPVKTELYQSAVVVEALKSLAYLAQTSGKTDVADSAKQEAGNSQILLNKSFWNSSTRQYAFALDEAGKQVNVPSVLASVPMWFGLLDESKSASMIERLSQPDIQTDWGMRIIPETDPRYDAAGYHSGTVWPLFTGWASVGEYRYHAALPAYENLRANALLTFDGSLGHVTEVLSGSYYQTLSMASPNQVWSSAMVISSLLRGMFGLETDALASQVTFNPHVPANWTSFSVNHVQSGSCLLDLHYRKTDGEIGLEIDRRAGTDCVVDFSPALSLRAQVTGVEFNRHGIPYRSIENQLDQHLIVSMKITEPKSTLAIKLRNDFGLGESFELPSLGSKSNGLRIVAESWNKDRSLLTLDAASSNGGDYELEVWDPGQIENVEGGEMIRGAGMTAKLHIHIDQGALPEQAHKQVVIHFKGPSQAKGHRDAIDAAMNGDSLVQ